MTGQAHELLKHFFGEFYTDKDVLWVANFLSKVRQEAMLVAEQATKISDK